MLEYGARPYLRLQLQEQGKSSPPRSLSFSILTSVSFSLSLLYKVDYGPNEEICFVSRRV